ATAVDDEFFAAAKREVACLVPDSEIPREIEAIPKSFGSGCRILQITRRGERARDGDLALLAGRQPDSRFVDDLNADAFERHPHRLKAALRGRVAVETNGSRFGRAVQLPDEDTVQRLKSPVISGEQRCAGRKGYSKARQVHVVTDWRLAQNGEHRSDSTEE